MSTLYFLYLFTQYSVSLFESTTILEILGGIPIQIQKQMYSLTLIIALFQMSQTKLISEVFL